MTSDLVAVLGVIALLFAGMFALGAVGRWLEHSGATKAPLPRARAQPPRDVT